MSALYQCRALADAMSEKLRVYAQPQRLMILSCLLEGEQTVGQIDDLTGIGQPALSQQLAELRRADLVRARRVAKQVHYTLADANVALCVRTMEAMMGENQSPALALQSTVSAMRPASADTLIPPGAAGFARIG